ncbi:MAG: hypothetical protein ACYTGC_08015 [Planctomycetota bacterium]|jgi:hypothetical protein
MYVTGFALCSALLAGARVVVVEWHSFRWAVNSVDTLMEYASREQLLDCDVISDLTRGVGGGRP